MAYTFFSHGLSFDPGAIALDVLVKHDVRVVLPRTDVAISYCSTVFVCRSRGSTNRQCRQRVAAAASFPFEALAAGGDHESFIRVSPPRINARAPGRFMAEARRTVDKCRMYSGVYAPEAPREMRPEVILQWSVSRDRKASRSGSGWLQSRSPAAVTGYK